MKELIKILKAILKQLMHKDLIPAESFKIAYSKSKYTDLTNKLKDDSYYHKMFIKSSKLAYIDKKLYEEYLIENNENVDSYNLMNKEFKEKGVL